MNIEARLSAAAQGARTATSVLRVDAPVRPMIAPLIATVFVLVLIVGGIWIALTPRATSLDAASVPPSPDLPVSAWSYEAWAGGGAELADFAGRPVVLNFWASWCLSCPREMRDALQPLSVELDGEVAFVGLNYQDTRGAAEDLVARTGAAYVLGVDPGGVFFDELGGIGLPFTVFLDESGEVVDLVHGEVDRALIESRLGELFGVFAT